MASVIVIPIILVAIIGLSGYLIYKYFVFDLLCKRSVNRTLENYKIKKTPTQIIREYYENKGDSLSDKEIQNLEKNYRQKEPDQFLAMYDAIRNNLKNNEKD
ncbi:hypothetical protein [Nitrosopumilus sp.]|uniref:hypothetical protein n=1 Tax=Nitrosopumilus sp. TaxID=2024843 RepID=UPI003B5914E6